MLNSPVPGAEFGYVPFAFSRKYPAFLANKEAKYASWQDLIYRDYNLRYSNAKYTHPFTTEQYKAVFGDSHEMLSAGQVAALQIVVQHLADPKLLAALGNKYDAPAWELYKKFRYRVTEDSSPFGAESNAVAKSVRLVCLPRGCLFLVFHIRFYLKDFHFLFFACFRLAISQSLICAFVAGGEEARFLDCYSDFGYLIKSCFLVAPVVRQPR